MSAVIFVISFVAIVEKLGQFKNKIGAEKNLKWCLAFRDSIKRREYHGIK